MKHFVVVGAFVVSKCKYSFQISVYYYFFVFANKSNNQELFKKYLLSRVGN